MYFFDYKGLILCISSPLFLSLKIQIHYKWCLLSLWYKIFIWEIIVFILCTWPEMLWGQSNYFCMLASAMLLVYSSSASKQFVMSYLYIMHSLQWVNLTFLLLTESTTVKSQAAHHVTEFIIHIVIFFTFKRTSLCLKASSICGFWLCLTEIPAPIQISCSNNYDN